jgi:hypothetical protein
VGYNKIFHGCTEMWIEWKESNVGTKFVALALRQRKVNVTLYEKGAEM